MVMPMRSSPSSSPCPSSGRRTKPSPVPQAMTLTEESLSETGGAPRAETSVTDTTARPSGRFFGRRTGPGAPGQGRGCASLRMTPFAGLFLRICYNTAPRRVPRPWRATICRSPARAGGSRRGGCLLRWRLVPAARGGRRGCSRGGNGFLIDRVSSRAETVPLVRAARARSTAAATSQKKMWATSAAMARRQVQGRRRNWRRGE
jgi:hypothetical protein